MKNRTTERLISIGIAAENFFHIIYMCRCISMNNDRLCEALDLIDQFSRCCDIHGDKWKEEQDKIIDKMKNFK